MKKTNEEINDIISEVSEKFTTDLNQKVKENEGMDLAAYISEWDISNDYSYAIYNAVKDYCRVATSGLVEMEGYCQYYVSYCIIGEKYEHYVCS